MWSQPPILACLYYNRTPFPFFVSWPPTRTAKFPSVFRPLNILSVAIKSSKSRNRFPNQRKNLYIYNLLFGVLQIIYFNSKTYVFYCAKINKGLCIPITLKVTALSSLLEHSLDNNICKKSQSQNCIDIPEDLRTIGILQSSSPTGFILYFFFFIYNFFFLYKLKSGTGIN